MGFEEFAKFYRPILNFSEEDFFNLLSILRKPLSSTLRITNTPFKEKIPSKLKKMTKSKFFPDVYHAPRQSIPVRGFVVNQTNAGNIQRQEVVSMLPVLLMGMKENFSVLDMCAAPGSKTKQLLEIINGEGLVVCNEISQKRSRILVRETSKIPKKGFLSINHDATTIPIFKTDFDRVLCDVPCSGDGTSRKNYDVVPNWSVDNALSLCELQFTILKRALNFIKDDGMIIYSTCSLNPIENECIVQKAVLELGLEIVDLRDFIDNTYFSKDFKLREGFRTWKMDFKEHNGINLQPINQDIGLEKCVRVFPHDQNTGGFFITGLRKIKDNKKEIKNNKNEIKLDDSEEIKLDDPEIEYNEMEKEVENKLKTVNITEEKKDFHLIDENLRSLLEKEYDIKDKILIIKNENTNHIYEISKEVYKILENHELKVTSHGYKLFEKNNFNESGYSLKTISKEMSHDIELTGDIQLEAIRTKLVQLEHEVGNVIVLFSDFNVKVSGYSHGDHISLNIENNLHRALRDFSRK